MLKFGGCWTLYLLGRMFNTRSFSKVTFAPALVSVVKIQAFFILYFKVHNISLYYFPGVISVAVHNLKTKVKSKDKLGNACYHSLQNLLSSSFAIQKFKDQDI